MRMFPAMSLKEERITKAVGLCLILLLASIAIHPVREFIGWDAIFDWVDNL